MPETPANPQQPEGADPAPAESPAAATGAAAEQAPVPSDTEPAPAPVAEPAAAPTAAAPVTQPDPRPRPAYGEYAPEGWEWKPEEAATGAAVPTAGGSAAGGSAAGGTGTAHNGGGSAAPHAGGSATPATVPGVPHNLGAGSKLPGRGARPAPAQPQGQQPQAPEHQAPPQQSLQQPGAPYRGDAPAQPQQQAPRYMGPAVPGSQPAGVQPGRPVDRVFTVLLLVLGAFGAVQSAFALMGLETAFKIMGEAPVVGSLTIPTWLGITTKVIGIAVLALYGMMLVYTIRRLRAGKLTFWVPLVAGVVAALVLFVVFLVAFLNTPELMEVIQDPQKANELIDYMRGVGQP